MVKTQDDGQTTDKVPKWAPNWYQLGVNAGGLTIICCLFIWQNLRTASPEVIQKNAADLTERLIDRTLTGLDKVVDKQDKLAEKQGKNIDQLSDVVKSRSREERERMTEILSAMEKMIKDAETYHKKSDETRNELNAILKKISNKLGADS